jgi:hypothetical protein
MKRSRSIIVAPAFVVAFLVGCDKARDVRDEVLGNEETKNPQPMIMSVKQGTVGTDGAGGYLADFQVEVEDPNNTLLNGTLVVTALDVATSFSIDDRMQARWAEKYGNGEPGQAPCTAKSYGLNAQGTMVLPGMVAQWSIVFEAHNSAGGLVSATLVIERPAP